jgi:hypothetical protein
LLAEFGENGEHLSSGFYGPELFLREGKSVGSSR